MSHLVYITLYGETDGVILSRLDCKVNTTFIVEIGTEYKSSTKEARKGECVANKGLYIKSSSEVGIGLSYILTEAL
jgi:hypothetical protein